MEPELGRADEGIPAADPGAGAPAPAEGYGIDGENPDRLDATGDHADPPDDPPTGDDVPFRTPDPARLQDG